MSSHYDYIIAGAGAAGLSLLMRMMNEPFFADKKILLVDKEPKQSNDRTWCFWEKQADIFESVVHHHWPQLLFQTSEFSAQQSIAPYMYKMIRSNDLYKHVFKHIHQRTNITVVYASVQDIHMSEDKVVAVTDEGTFSGNFLFNSILFQPLKRKKHSHLLLQHFKGYFIETSAACFDPKQAVFMDFRVSQEHGSTFFYVLPVSSQRALIEYTLFTENLLEENAYDAAIKKYIGEQYPSVSYTVEETEFGIIPMTNMEFRNDQPKILHIGTAGGWTKPSTGFTFKFIQKNTAAIIDAIISGKSIHAAVAPKKRFHFYDSVFLNVLANRRMEGKDIFEKMFRKNSMQSILSFLDNERNLGTELKILKSLPVGTFTRAAMNELKPY